MAGCTPKTSGSKIKSQQTVTPTTTPAPAPKPAPEPKKENRIGLCQSELASLKKVNEKAYAARKAYFDSLVSNASVYSSVRGEVNSQTKDTLDALYKYKTNQVCAQIERDVLDALIRRGESVK